MGKFSSEKIKECADWVRENGLIDNGGASVKAFRKAMDISAQTLSRWNKRSEFSDAIEKAKQEFADGHDAMLYRFTSRDGIALQ